MDNTKLESFKSLFTERMTATASLFSERMTATAIELFVQVENIVQEHREENKRLNETLSAMLHVENIAQEYREENKRLKETLGAVFMHPIPEIRLCRIDDSALRVSGRIKLQVEKSLSSEQDQGSEASTTPTLERASVDQVLPETCHVKEEPETPEISRDDATTPIILKVEGDAAATSVIEPPKVEDDSATTSIILKIEVEAATASLIDPPKVEDGDSFPVLKVESCRNDGSVSTMSDLECDDGDADDHPQGRRKKCSQCKECGQSVKRKGGRLKQKTKKKARKPVQKTILQLPRTTVKPYDGVVQHDKTFFSRLVEAFKDMPDDKKPLIARMGLKDDVQLVDSAFGKVPQGCPISYHYPLPSSRDYTPHDTAPPPPSLPLASHKLGPALSPPVLSDKSQEHMKSLETTWDGAHNLELSTRGLTGTVEELRKFRLTSRFMEICQLKAGGKSQARHLAAKIQKGTRESTVLKRDAEVRPEALREYCRQMFVNWSPCGLVVHPDAPWLAAIPDGMIYDPTETPSYGLVFIKCPKVRSFVECNFLDFQYGILELKKNHAHYYQMQGEMMVTGTEWCDMVVYAEDDILVQRIYRNKSIFKTMKLKLDDFFFHHYLPSLNSV